MLPADAVCEGGPIGPPSSFRPRPARGRAALAHQAQPLRERSRRSSAAASCACARAARRRGGRGPRGAGGGPTGVGRRPRRPSAGRPSIRPPSPMKVPAVSVSRCSALAVRAHRLHAARPARDHHAGGRRGRPGGRPPRPRAKSSSAQHGGQVGDLRGAHPGAELRVLQGHRALVAGRDAEPREQLVLAPLEGLVGVVPDDPATSPGSAARRARRPGSGWWAAPAQQQGAAGGERRAQAGRAARRRGG